MIHQIGSNLDSFKTLNFKQGLNVLLSDKSDSSATRLTRNGAGKSSLVEIVHFLTGGQAGRDSIFQNKHLIQHQFYATIDLEGETIKVSRSGSKPNSITLEGKIPHWSSDFVIPKEENQFECKTDNWKLILGKSWFDLPNSENQFAAANKSLTFRSIFPYFARKKSDGGFQSPDEFFAKQNQLISKTSVGYLLGLDWNLPFLFHEQKTKEKLNQQINKASQTEILGQYFGNMADIRTRLAIVEGRSKELLERVNTFNVVPKYGELEKEANDLTAEIHSMNTDNLFDSSLLDELKFSIEEENEPDYNALEKTYEDAGLVFPEMVSTRIESVKQFHKAIIENRQAHLKDEIQSTEHRIEVRKQEIIKKDERRQEIMKILSEGGALEHYTNLREEAAKLKTDAKELQHRLNLLEKFNETKAELKISRGNLNKKLLADLHERKPILDKAIQIFEELSISLYEKAGSLKIFESENGPIFKVEIDSQRSSGISNMQIFCFDLMLMILNRKLGKCPDFLIHDSHLFDGVDERQTAKALEIANEYANKVGFQYIVTMNTDVVPYDCFSSEFDIHQHKLDTVLSDKTDTGGLFGIHF